MEKYKKKTSDAICVIPPNKKNKTSLNWWPFWGMKNLCHDGIEGWILYYWTFCGFDAGKCDESLVYGVGENDDDTLLSYIMWKRDSVLEA